MKKRNCNKLGALAALIGGLGISVAIPAYASDDPGFDAWLQAFKAQAIEEGVKPSVVEHALTGVTLDETVITLDRKQPETKVTLAKYLSNTVNARRVREGKALLAEYRPVLEKISAQYEVQPNYILALWGVESDYGAFKGNFSVVQSLATLAYEGRRREFFSKELIAALRIIDAENMEPYELSGSWAGAMGDCQFMPSTYLIYAADGNQDGHRDIWNSASDVFASIANYLQALGWKNDRGWGTIAHFPDHFSESDADISRAKTLAQWRNAGVKPTHMDELGEANTPLYAIYAGTINEGGYLITDNYKALLQWNRSRYFATAVGMLADQIGE